jgi:arylformamidase
MKIIDISQEVLSCKVYEGDPVPKANKIIDMEDGGVYNLSVLSLCAHNGTHVDAPLHFLTDGKSIDEMSLEHFVGECYVAEHSGDVLSTDAREILEKAKKVGAGKRVLIKGEATVTEEAARVFAEADILLLGNESQSVGPENAPMVVHKILLSKEIVLLEGIFLENVKEGRYILNCAPLNIKGFEGSPCRAILVEE